MKELKEELTTTRVTSREEEVQRILVQENEYKARLERGETITQIVASERGRVEGEEVDKIALNILEKHFPKMNQDDVTKPSPNGRGVALAYYGLLKAALLAKE